MPRRTGEERVKPSSVYLTRRYILQVLLYSDLLSSAFFFFYLSFHCRRVWGERDGWKLKWIDCLSDLLVSEIYYSSQVSYIRMKNYN